MNASDSPADEWDIRTNIGPIVLTISLDASFQGNDHQHDERHQHATHEFHLIAEGSGTICADGIRSDVTAGGYYIVRTGMYHTLSGKVGDPIRRMCFKFEFDIDNRPCGGYSEEEAKRFIHLLSNIGFFYSRDAASIRDYIGEIQSELEAGKLGFYSRIQHLFSMLFIAVIRDIAAESGKAPVAAGPRRMGENRNKIIEDFFDANYGYKAATADLCRLIRISRSQLNRILKEKYHMTFKQKHMETQIEHIKDMLVHTDLPIGAISERIGYAAECGFATFFRRATGMSPTEYRKSLLRGDE